MRYEIDENDYIINVYFGCYGEGCIEYNGEIPEGYETLALWADNANIRAYKIINGNLVYDRNRDEKLQLIYEIEKEENANASCKWVNDKLKISSNVVKDELALEFKSNSNLIILNETGNYDIPEFRLESSTLESVNVITSNKNLLGVEAVDTTKDGVEFVINDGTIELNGTASEMIEFDLNGSISNNKMKYLIKKDTNYVIGGLTTGVSLSLYSNEISLGSYANNEVINLSETYVITRTALLISNGMQFENTIIKPQLEINKVPTEFVKHEETKGVGIFYDYECYIDGLTTFDEKTVIMIDEEANCNITYYKYQYLTDRITTIEANEEGIITQVTNMNTNIENQNEKISQISQTVSEIKLEMSEVADITISGETENAKLEFTNINTSEPIYIKIKAKENISYLYPNNELYPSNNLYPKTRTLRFTNTETKEVFDYELPSDLLYYDEENYDEFVLDYNSQTCTVSKKIGYAANGTTYVLDNPKMLEFEYPIINMTGGDYTIELLGIKKAYIFARLMIKNIYTDQFATKLELNSAITQTADAINLEVSKKVGNNEVISKINQSAEEISIEASKINLSGKTLNLADNMAIKSNNFNVDSRGNMSCNDANILGGNVTLFSDSRNSGKKSSLSVQSEDFSEYTSIYKDGISSTAENTGLWFEAAGTPTQFAVSIQEDGHAYFNLQGTSNGVTNYVRIHGDTGTIEAENYHYHSLEELKKNIKLFDEDSINIIKNSNIYTYNFEHEKDDTKKHIGFVIGKNFKTPKAVINEQETGVDVYSMCSILWKALQEQQVQIEKLKEEIENMKGE